MTLIISKGLNLRNGYIGTDDPDAQAYIAAVEAADEAASPGVGALELGVKVAIHSFVKGCKNDGIWPAIKASCILAGARTLSGALVPLVGTAPTKVGTAGGWDYNRETGLKGNGTDNYLTSNRNNNADPQNNNHNAVFPTTVGTGIFVATLGGSQAGNNLIGLNGIRNRHGSDALLSTSANAIKGTARSNGANYIGRSGGSNVTIAVASETPQNSTLAILGTANTGGTPIYSTHRISFYSIGESLDLALLDARVTDLMTAFAAAIP